MRDYYRLTAVSSGLVSSRGTLTSWEKLWDQTWTHFCFGNKEKINCSVPNTLLLSSQKKTWMEGNTGDYRLNHFSATPKTPLRAAAISWDMLRPGVNSHPVIHSVCTLTHNFLPSLSGAVDWDISSSLQVVSSIPAQTQLQHQPSSCCLRLYAMPNAPNTSTQPPPHHVQRYGSPWPPPASASGLRGGIYLTAAAAQNKHPSITKPPVESQHMSPFLHIICWTKTFPSFNFRSLWATICFWISRTIRRETGHVGNMLLERWEVEQINYFKSVSLAYHKDRKKTAGGRLNAKLCCTDQDACDRTLCKSNLSSLHNTESLITSPVIESLSLCWQCISWG